MARRLKRSTDETNRRSPRVVLRIPISLIAGQGPPGEGITAVVNQHGALVLSPTAYQEGTILWVRNELNQETTRCRVVWVGLADADGTHKLGIEFIDESQTFWGPTYRPIGDR